MRKLLLLLVFPVLLFAGKSSVQYDTVTHGVVKPPTSASTIYDLDFTGLNIGGLATGPGGNGTPGGANQQLQFNSAFTFGGVPYATYDGTTVTFRTGARFTLADPTDATKRVQLAITGTGLKTVTISDNQVTVTPSTPSGANQYATGLNGSGVLSYGSVPFSGLTGTLALSQTTMSAGLTGKLIGRGTAGTGPMEEITVGANLTLDPVTHILDATGGGGTPGGSTAQFQYNNAGAFAGQNSLIFSGGNVLGRSNTFHIFDNSDNTAMFHFSTANIPTATDETVLIPNSANPVVVGGASAVASQWVRYIDNLGVQQRSQPTYADLGGSPTLAQQSIPINLERFVDPINGSDISGSANLARPFLTLAGAALAAPAGTVIYAYPNITGYDQSTTPLVIPAGVTIAGAGAGTTVIKGAVTGVTRAVVEPGSASAIYNVTIQNTSSTGVAFGVGSSSTAFTSAYVGGSRIVANAQGIYINKAGTTGLVVENTTITTQNDCVFQNISTATSEFRNCDLIADGTATLTESKGLNVMNGTARFNYGSIAVGGATGTNVGAFGSGATSTIELHGVRVSNALGGATNYDVQAQSSATVGVDNVTRPDAGALVTNGTITQLSRYALRDNNLTDFPNLGSGTRGDIIYRDATGWTKLGAGIDGNVLTTHGTTANPTWATAGTGSSVDDTAFGVVWNGSTVTAPSQNAAYDYLHLIAPADDGKVALLSQTAGITRTNGVGLILTPLTAPAGAIVGDTDTQTLTNKRITKRRLATAAPGPTPAVNIDNYDVVHFTGMSADITSLTTNLTGTPQPADTLRFDFTDDGTPRAITWGASFVASPGQALPIITTASTRLDVGFVWDNVASKWRCLASSNPIITGGTGTVTSVGVTGLNGISVSGSPVTTSGSITLSLPITLAGTVGKTLTVSNNLTLAGTDGSTLNVGAGGTLGTNAFTSTAYLDATNISDSVFATAWNGDTTTAPSKNAIYDWAHTFDTNNNGKVDVLDVSTAGLIKTDSSGNVSVALAGTDYADLSFRSIAVSGNTTVVADAANDTLTLAAGTGMTITTTAGTDTITFASTGGSSGTVTSVDILGTANQVTVTGTSPITTSGSLTLSIPSSAQISMAKNTLLTTNGFVKTSGSDGTLSVDTATYLTTASAASTYQPLDSDLTTIAGLTATTDNFMIAASSAWASRTPAQARTSLGLVIGTNVEAWDADLDTWATLTPSANFQTMVPHTFAQMRTDLGLVIGTNVQAWDADLDTWATKTAPSGTVVGTTDTQTLTNKRINPRATGGCEETSSSTSTPDSDNCDQWDVTALAATDTFVAPSGTPVNGQKLIIRIKDNGTAQTLSFPTGSSGQYKFSTDLAAPITTILGKTFYLGFIYNTASSRWENVSQLNNF